MESKIKFINEIIEETIIINKKTRKEIITQLYEKEYILGQFRFWKSQEFNSIIGALEGTFKCRGNF